LIFAAAVVMAAMVVLVMGVAAPKNMICQVDVCVSNV
jgi:hypothetical protein